MISTATKYIGQHRTNTFIEHEPKPSEVEENISWLSIFGSNGAISCNEHIILGNKRGIPRSMWAMISSDSQGSRLCMSCHHNQQNALGSWYANALTLQSLPPMSPLSLVARQLSVGEASLQDHDTLTGIGNDHQGSRGLQ